MVPLLKAYRLLGYAYGSVPPSAINVTVKDGDSVKEVSNPEYDQWIIKGQIALTIILLAIMTKINA